MSLTSALFSGVSGLNSQSSVLAVIGDNIANVSTVGFKAGNTSFASLVTGSGNQTNGSGVSASTRVAVDQQGLIQSTGIATDIAISGQGFFVVKNNANLGEGEYLYTRAGSFRQDQQGNFVNSSGYYLQAYPLDNEGRLPGATGNSNTTSSQLLEATETVNTRDISGLAFATTSISLGLNLNATESILTGAGDTLQPVSTANDGVGADDVLAIGANTTVGDSITVTLGDTSTFEFVYGGVAYSPDIATANTNTGIYGALSASGKMTELETGDSFSITTNTIGTVTFTYNDAAANADLGTFNTLETLAAAIDAVTGLSARVTGGQLYVAPDDANELMTFADVATVSGVDIIGDADFGATFATTTLGAGNRFASMQGLANLVNDTNGISASIESVASDSILRITVDDPLQSILFTDTGAGTGNLITEFGFPAQTLAGAAVPLESIYDAANGRTMASGEISPAFSRNIRVFDGQGVGHDLRISFAKAANNTWLAEVYAANPDDVVITGNTDGLIASGTILFNGDGSLRQVSSSLSNAIEVVWSNGTGASNITLNLGTAGISGVGLADGLSQFAGNYNVQFAEQNGAGSGLLSSIEITEDGFVVANFTNGQSRRVYQIPLASFPNVNGLNPKAGNSFSASDASGEFSLGVPGGSGVGVISTAALENANTDLATELTKMIVAQRAFQSNTKIITTADQLLEELNRISS